MLDGKKTYIATGALWIAAFLSEVVVGIWDFDPEWMNNVIQTLNWVGGLTGAIGVGHKAIKSSNKSPLIK